MMSAAGRAASLTGKGSLLLKRNSMTRKKLLSMSLLTAAFCGSVRAVDVYVYQNGNFKPVSESKDLYKIVFGEDSTRFVTEDGGAVTLSNGSFAFLTFREADIPTGAASAREDGADIACDGEGITVRSGSPLARVTVADSSGRVLADVKPRDASVYFSLQGLPPGVYIVRAHGGNGVTTKKVTKRR